MKHCTHPGPLAETFSIVGYDPSEPAWGVAIASRFLAVGAGTCWGRAGAGVVVIQAHFNMRNGEEGLAMLRAGQSAEDVLARLMVKDRHRDVRQMGVIDSRGMPATYSGEHCNQWAGGRTAEHCSAQGNTLGGPHVIDTMIDRFTSEGGSLAHRLVDALSAGEAAGGDQRGKEATALLVVRQDEADLFDVFSHRTIDLRVDNHPEPFKELARLLDRYELLHYPPAPEDQLPPEPHLVRRLQRGLERLGYFNEEPNGVLDDATQTALMKLSRYHNLRQRLSSLEWLDHRVLEYVEREARHVAAQQRRPE